jgi:hypothetical protein
MASIALMPSRRVAHCHVSEVKKRNKDFTQYIDKYYSNTYYRKVQSALVLISDERRIADSSQLSKTPLTRDADVGVDAGLGR